MPNMESAAHHRNQQSFDTTRSARTFGPLESPVAWRQPSTPRAVASHTMVSPIWTPQPGEARLLQQQQHHHHHHQQQQHQQQQHHNNYQHHQPQQHPDPAPCVTDKPTPAQVSFLNSWLNQTTDNYAYYLDRGNGYVTRLIPADVLPALSEIPAQEATAAGMEVLQPLKGSPPVGVQDMNQRVTIKNGGRSSRRDKLYCDKWVHEGICAFEQQGCRYLHDMPSDKATQVALGLFQGYPAWWKKHQADVQRQRAMIDGQPLDQKQNRQQQQPPTQTQAQTQTQTQTQQQQEQQQHRGQFGVPLALPTNIRDALADSEPDSPAGARIRGGWRRDAGAGGAAAMAAQGNRRANRPWSTDATMACFQYSLGAIEPPVPRRF